MTDLPVEDALPELKAALRERPEAVLEAPTGAGKTTRVPLALLGEEWLGGKDGAQKLIVLEPRRLAARAAARRMAQLLGEKVGQTVGYRVRMDTQVGRATRIEVVTEGILTRFLQDDPTLDGIGGVVFDEFHERSLPADLGLALCLDARAALRPDLRLLAMSATLDAGPVAALLGDDDGPAPRIQSEGRAYPVEVQYRDRAPDGRLENYTARAVRRALQAEPEGDVLVFLPGAGEIRRTQRALDDGGLPEGVTVRPLFGSLSQKKQDAAIRPGGHGQRKVVLSTDIAETSLTIEGVTVVVDSGFRRAPRFDAQSGMTRLETVRVSKASADQRKGRAGRVQPGTCYRLWTRHRQQHLADFAPPEIAKADLAPLALELACWGASAPGELRWLDPPPERPLGEAQDLLRQLGALNEQGRVTPHGRRMAGLGLHPRLAHLLLEAEAHGLGAAACDLAALLDRRDPFKGRGEAPDADLRLRLQALRDLRAGRTPREGKSYRVSRGALHGARKAAGHFRRKLGVARKATVSADDVEAAGLLVAWAYPDRIAQRSDRTGGSTPGGRRAGQDGRFRLRSGPGAALARPQLLSDADYLAIAQLGGRGAEGTIFLAAPLTGADLEERFAGQIREEERVAWDGGAGRVRARRERTLGALVLSGGPLQNPAPSALAEALLDGVREEGLGLLPWTEGARRLQERLVFLRHHLGDQADAPWPDATDEALLAQAEDWLLPHLFGKRSPSDLARLNLTELLKGRLTYEQRGRLDALAPTHLEVPSGSRRPIDYADPEAPVLAARIQELFGLTETPRIAGGRVALTLHLLSPAQRPAQITQDLESFWRDTYFEVKKDLQGRYPKHYWPDDPFAATPTSRVRPEQ